MATFYVISLISNFVINEQEDTLPNKANNKMVKLYRKQYKNNTNC